MRARAALLTTLVGIVALSAPSSVSAAGASFMTLGQLPGSIGDTEANGVSGDGSVVVGFAWVSSSDNKAFRWTAQGGYQILPEFGPGQTRANDAWRRAAPALRQLGGERRRNRGRRLPTVGGTGHDERLRVTRRLVDPREQRLGERRGRRGLLRDHGREPVRARVPLDAHRRHQGSWRDQRDRKHRVGHLG
ncbi:MAG: hypothetical protein E6J13_13035 [Chloroflexi bacterium]|nr:MAG: hypothetical protein E6J13_13035 [Chloroflexota bacterium]